MASSSSVSGGDTSNRRPKGGRLKEAHDTSEMISKFESIRDSLMSDARKTGQDYGTIRSADLAKLCGDLQQFMEDEFGVTAKQQGREWLMTRIPAKLFRDYSSKGPLFTILRTAYAHKEMLQWRVFNFEAKGGKREENIGLFLSIQRALQEARQWKLPKIYLDSTVPEAMKQSLKRKAEAHAATVMESKERATHIVMYDSQVDGKAASDTNYYLRPLKLVPEKGVALVHWWYHPDSYDEWIPLDEVQDGEEEDDRIPGPPYHVCCRYIQDMDQFNEWGNEADYEVMTGGSSSPEKKRKLTNKKEGSSQVAQSTAPSNKKSSGGGGKEKDGEMKGDKKLKSPGLVKKGGGAGTSPGSGKIKSKGDIEKTKVKIKDKTAGGDHKISKKSKSSSEGGGAGGLHKSSSASSMTSDKQKDGGEEHVVGKKRSAEGEGNLDSSAQSHKRSRSDAGVSNQQRDKKKIKSSKDEERRKKKDEEDEDGEEEDEEEDEEDEEGTQGGGAGEESSTAGGSAARSRYRGGGGTSKRMRNSKEAMAQAEAKRAKARREAAVSEFAGLSEAKGGETVPPSERPPQGSSVTRLTDLRSGSVREIQRDDGPVEDGNSSDEEGKGKTQKDKKDFLAHLKASKSLMRGFGQARGAGIETPPLPILEPLLSARDNISIPSARPSRVLPHLASELGWAWFDESTIHPIEKRYLSEFFAGKIPYKTPEVYLAYRSHMMEESKASPHEYLTYTDCRRRLAGDAGAILRVHEFLDRWGLINAEVPDELRPPNSSSDLRGVGMLPILGPCPPSTRENEDDEAKWTEEELGRLKKAAIELKDDWQSIVVRVGSQKDVADCVLKFLSLALETDLSGGCPSVPPISTRKGRGQPQASNGHHTSSTQTLLPSPTSASGVLPIGLVKQLVNNIDPDVVKSVLATSWTHVLKKKEAVAAKHKSKEFIATTAAASDAEGKVVPMEVDGAEEKENGQEAGGNALNQAMDLVENEGEAYRVSSTAILSLMGLEARALADIEEAEAKRMMDDLLELKLTKLELKSKQLEEMEKLLVAEREMLQREREDIFLRRAQGLV